MRCASLRIADDTRFARAVQGLRICGAGLSVYQGRTSTQAVVTRRARHASHHQSGTSVRTVLQAQECKQRLTRSFGRGDETEFSDVSALAASGPNLFSKYRTAWLGG